jgi:Extensin-like protein C-terminus
MDAWCSDWLGPNRTRLPGTTGGHARLLTDNGTMSADAIVEAHFIRRMQEGACGTFSTVLGPDANEAHRNHLHLDLASRRRHAFCE